MQMAPTTWQRGWPDHVWAGTSAGTQETANQNIPALLAVPACVRFISCEPQLEYVDFRAWLGDLHWIICGGESGLHTRPLNLDWARDIRDQCIEASIPFFFKQIGGRYHHSKGRLLDGRTWDEMPAEKPEQFML